MTIEDVKKATIDDAKELLSLAKQYDVDGDVYDLDADPYILADIISDKMKDSGIEAVYNFIKDVAESRSPLAVIDNYGDLRPFEEADLDDLKKRLCEKVFPARDSEILEDIEEAVEQKYSMEGVSNLDQIARSYKIDSPILFVEAAGDEAFKDLCKMLVEFYGQDGVDEVDKFYGCSSDSLIIIEPDMDYYREADFNRDRDDLVAKLRSRLTDITA